MTIACQGLYPFVEGAVDPFKRGDHFAEICK